MPKVKTRYTDKELEVFGKLIDEKLVEAQNQLEYYINQISEFGESEDARVRGIDDSNGTVEQERMMTMASRQKKMIRHLQNAQSRVANKVYGVCRETGKLISKKRLLVVPHATLSIEAKQKS